MPPPGPLNPNAAIKLVAVLLFLSFHFYSNSQTLNWAFKAGGTSRDEATFTHVDNAGNVLVTGLFSGTADFDPSAAVYTLTSAGSEDIFVAKYTSAGQFLWAFRVGGSDRDHGLSITSDASNNVIVTGFFRGSNVDFDPSAATASLTSNGDAGSDPGYGGDMFVAKYNSAGQYQWAFHVGGSTMYDSGVAVATDAASNIYIGGYFREIVDFDPSAAVSTLNSLGGTIFLSKYSPTGNYQWAFNTGLGDQDNAIFDMKVDNNGNVYVAGYFQGTNIDFDPSAGTALLSSNGGFEIFFAKYTTNSQYVFAHSIGGTSIDVARGIDIDNNGNIYVIGDFTGSNIDFNPGAGTAMLTSNGSADVFLAKYTNNGNYVWAFNFGAGASDIGWKLSTDNTHLFVTGGFTGTSDMNPSAVVDNLVSNGGNDIFLGKYNLNGEYLCAFNIGGPFNDYGSAIRTAGTNIFYLTGYFQGSNVDFDPTPTTFNLSSNGGNDVFLSKFTWPDNVPPAGTLSGSVICAGQQAQLNFTATAGTGPFTIVYNNGTSNVTVTNVQSGVGFNIVPNPTSTTTYTLVSIRDAARCSETTPASGTATITVNNCGTSCNKWLSTPGHPGSVTVGDVDVTGNQITVEAMFNRVPPLNSGIYYGHLVSKHTGPGNVNYSILPNGCEITTDVSGYVSIFPTCPIDLNKTYHIAMVYNGTTLKFYRNGFLMAQAPCTGNMVTNDLATTIAQVGGGTNPLINQMLGYTNEVRIWNVARTQSQIQTYMNSSLPNPTTQSGLVAYYIFDDLLNKQGNTAYNGTLNGSAVINSTNPQCNFIADSCTLPSIVINDYTPVLSFDPCKNIINVGDAGAFNIGDTVLLIQMKGAVIDSSNTSAFGTVTNYRNAGNYEFNYVKSKNGNSIELLNKVERQYDLPNGKVQLIRVPYFQNYTVPNTSVLSCLPWNGSVGGVLVFNVQNTLTLNGNINVTGKGFLGGQFQNTNINATNCFTNNYFYPNGTQIAATKGESIATISNNISSGKGASASAGGGGNDHNSGGGGGGNATSGGLGGYQLYECNNTYFDNRGIGGRGLLYNNTSNKIFMGGGGGAGHCNNGFVTPTENTNYNGGNGGGIVLITTNTITANNNLIIARGDSAFERNSPSGETHDGMGGGGAGGTVLISANNYTNNLNINVGGGKGGDMHASMAGGHIGPGGGGAGGVVWVKQTSIPANVTINNNGGRGGYLLQENNNPYGTTPGSAGMNVFGLQIPIDDVLFKPNIDSVRIKDSLTTCTDFDFKGLAYTNTNPITSWRWYFGDGQTATSQNTSHSYAPGNYTVKLVVTDVNGCKDSITTNILATTLTVDAGNDTTICGGQTVMLQATTNGGTQFQWNNLSLLSNGTILNPLATPTANSTTFTITATNAAGCSDSDSVNVMVRAQNIFAINAPSPICPNDSTQLLAQGGDIYSWQPSSGINSTIANPIVSPSFTTLYTVQITDTVCNQTKDLSTQVVVLPVPNVQAFKQNDIDCIETTARLNATGAMNYKWTPSTSLNNSNIANPIATPTTTTLYTVEGTDASGCKNTDTISVVVDFSLKNGLFYVPNAFTPNNDGLNDCFGVKMWGALEAIEFNIYNRWGELIFHTTDASKCWDGKWKGKEQDPAVFVYWIRAKSICGGDVFRKGTIVLIR